MGASAGSGMGAGRPWLKRRAPELAAAAAYLLLSGAYAWRVVAGFGSHLAGHGGDAFQNLWNMWWFERALTGGQNPWFTDMLHHPGGTTLLMHTLSPLNCLLALPVDALFGQPAAYNTVFLFAFAASGLTMYLLLLELTGDRWAAFLAGCAFTFSHYHFAHAQGHLNLTAMQWFPLFLLGLVRTWRRRRKRDGLLLGGAMLLLTLTEMYYAVFAGTVALLAAAVQAVRLRQRLLDARLLRAVGLGAGLWLVTGGVLVAVKLYAWATTDFVAPHDPRWFSADLQGFFVPGWISAWAGSFEGWWRDWTGNSAENSWYLGWSVLALAALAFILRPRGRRPWAWLGLAGFGLLMALGPVLHWGGRILDAVPLPYQLAEIVMPWVRISGVPGRWHFLALVACCVLAGLGAAAVAARLGRRRLGRLPVAPLVLLGATGLILLELAPRGIEVRPLEQPGFSAALRARPAAEVVFDLGDWNRALLRQTGHQHPMIGGYISRCTQADDDFWLRSDFTQTLRGHRRLAPAAVRRRAAGLGLRYLIVPDWHRPRPRPERFGARPLWRDGPLRVWWLVWPGETEAGPETGP